ncbi:fused MFS/spermidine synthase [Achromobacter sp. GG226]|uniref:spermidine synthase n=1 Tax=Verticiella alkaliphila TaxID=2779529 RepID=UPI001C0C00CF|nr:fused MFS/spermidine synthase [Verticiella sp. GG226]MBU4610441.1 fused MFS/spermidine synthase [Verticiella sp. GG226]
MTARTGSYSAHLALALAAACGPLHTANAQLVVHVEPSTFSPIVVYEEADERCMTFGAVRAAGRQTCQALNDPQHMVFAYSRMMMSALFAHPDPRRILVIGLGGGTLSRALVDVLPEAQVDTVEIDPAVLKVATEHFGFAQGPRQTVHIADGRAFVEQAAAQGRQYDLIFLDAFDVTYIPPHLLTREFLTLVRERLAPGGILAANTFTASGLYAQESSTYAAVFGRFYNLRESNRVIIAARDTLPDAKALRARAQALAPRLAPYGIDVNAQLQGFRDKPDWPAGARILTDKEPVRQ